jgi:hypothetical protein
MSQENRLDMDMIAEALGAERKGQVRSTGGWFGAAQLVADVQTRFRTPAGGGRSTDPEWTERRLVPLKPETLRRLEGLSVLFEKHGLRASSLQLAALLLEKAVSELGDDEAADLARRVAG